MNETTKTDFLDYILVLIQNKKKLIATFAISLIVSYVLIFFFIEKQYESKVLLLPSGSGDNSLAGVSSMLKNVSSILPLGLGSINKESEMDLYNTIIYSRTALEHFLDKFDLQKEFKIQRRDDALKIASKIITTNITLQNAYEISVRTGDPKLSADIANYIVEYLNKKVIDLNVQKARNNKEFLAERYFEIGNSLNLAEDSLRAYQEKTGLYEPEHQVMAIVDAYAALESEYSKKQVESNILSRMYGNNSVLVKSTEISLNELSKKIEELKNGETDSKILVGLDKLPLKVLEYYRLYRNVKIYNEMLQYILPLYEQSKFEEQKLIPVLQIIDKAIIPERKMYPPRVMMAGISAIVSVLFSMVLIVSNFYLNNNKNDKLENVRKLLF